MGRSVKGLRVFMNINSVNIIEIDTNQSSVDRGLDFLQGSAAVDSNGISARLPSQLTDEVREVPWPSLCGDCPTDDERMVILEDASKLMTLVCQQNQLIHLVTFDSLIAIGLRTDGFLQSRREQ